MKTNRSLQDSADVALEFTFLQTILDRLPAVVYINELQTPGDPLSCRNVWTNKTGLDLVGYSQKEITEMGYRYFQQILHPDDLEILPIPIELHYADTSMHLLVCMQRIRYKGQAEYHWSYGQGVVIASFKDGSPRQLLVVAMDITESMHSDNQLTAALKEIKRLKSSLKLSAFTKREKEILQLIVQGKTDRDIASALFISLKTAKKHRTNIICKAGVKNSAGLVGMVMEAGEF